MYETVLGQVDAMGEDEVTAPGVPVHVFIHESLRLYDWVVQDRQAPEGVGLPLKATPTPTCYRI